MDKQFTKTAWVIFALLFLSACTKNSGSLSSHFELSKSVALTGEIVDVSEVTTEPDQTEWFVDGAFYSNERKPLFSFNSSGTHQIELRVSKGKRQSGSSIKKIEVRPGAKILFWQSTTAFSEQVAVSVFDRYSKSGWGGFTIPSYTGTITAGCISEPAWGGGEGLSLIVLAADTITYTAGLASTSGTTPALWKGRIFIPENGTLSVELK